MIPVKTIMRRFKSTRPSLFGRMSRRYFTEKVATIGHYNLVSIQHFCGNSKGS
jgi:hypothetical protein